MDKIKEFISLGQEQLVKNWLNNYKNGLSMMDEDGSTVLHYACSENKLAIVELLLKKNASPNTQDAAGWTPFHVAASSRYAKICKILLKYDGNPSIKNNSNSTPFQYLARANRDDPITQLDVLKDCINNHNVDILTRNELGETILHTACLRGSVDIINFLIERKADVNAVNIRAENSLHYAVRSGHPEFVTLLLKNGVNSHQKSLDGKQAMDEAEEFKIMKVLTVLEDHFKESNEQPPWGELPFNGEFPKKLSYSALACANKYLWLFGGSISAVQYSNILYYYSLETQEWEYISTKGEKIPQLGGHSMISINNSLYLFGGRNAMQTCNEIIKFDTDYREWKLIVKTETPRCYHSCSLLDDNERLFIFGGSSVKGRAPFLNSIDIININNGLIETIEETENTPCPRMQHGSAVCGSNIYIWGGKDDKNVFNDLYIFNIDTQNWTNPTCNGDIPSPRYGFTFIAKDKNIYLHGGAEENKRPTNDLYVLDTVSLSWKKYETTTPRLVGHSVTKKDDEFIFIGWTTKPEIFTLNPYNLGTECESVAPWVPDSVNKRGKVKIISSTRPLSHSKDDSLDTKSSDRLSDPGQKKKGSHRGVSKKLVMDRLEKLEYFSNTLTNNVYELLQCVEQELENENSFAEQNAQITLLCNTIQEFCVSEKPSKTWAGTGLSATIKEEITTFPLYHYEQLNVPPKRIKPSELENSECNTEEDKILRSRNLVFNEIITTETDYVRDLAVLIGLYLRPLREEFKDIIGVYEVKNMFKNAEALWDVHLDILHGLQEEEKKPPKEQNIGSVLMKIKDALEEYNVYCANQVTSTETANKVLKENTKFRELAEEIRQMEQSNRLEFESYLLKPFQRICRYPLLLKELIKQTPDDWNDKQIIEEAMTAINNVVSTANETKRVNDKMSAIFELQDKLIIPPKNPELSHLFKFSYVCEYEGFLEVDTKKGKIKKGLFVLFEEKILLTVKKGSKLSVFKVLETSKTYCAIPAVIPKCLHGKFCTEFSSGDFVCLFGANSEKDSKELMKEFKDTKKAFYLKTIKKTK